MDATVARQDEAARKYLTFTLGAEEYGLPVLKGREIIKVTERVAA